MAASDAEVPNGDPQRAVASKWMEKASPSEACLCQTELGGPLSTSSCCGPESGGWWEGY